MVIVLRLIGLFVLNDSGSFISGAILIWFDILTIFEFGLIIQDL